MWTIKKTLLEDLIESSMKYQPNEFMCFLGGDKKKEIVEEIVFLPNESGETFASIQVNAIPFDDSIIGSFHSHPGNSSRASTADKKFFKKYEINIIFAIYSREISFYNSEGKEIQVRIRQN
jgi:proteasome lid subunit RPN8/RPN11